MVRPETKPDDVHGMLAAQGILTSRGGRTSHAALVARQFGKPAVVGVSELKSTWTSRQMPVGDRSVQRRRLDLHRRHHWVRSIAGKLDTMVPDIQDPWLHEAARLGRRVSDASGSGPTPTIRRTPSAPGTTAPRASVCAAPSTCSSKPNACRSSRR